MEFDSNFSGETVTLNSYWSPVAKTSEPLYQAIPDETHGSIVTVKGYNNREVKFSFKKESIIKAEEHGINYNSIDLL